MLRSPLEGRVEHRLVRVPTPYRLDEHPGIALTEPDLSQRLLAHLRHSPFWDQGSNALRVIDTSFLRNPHDHRMSDSVATLDLAFFWEVVEGVAKALETL